MPEVRIVSNADRVKRRFQSTLDPDDAAGARLLLQHWQHRLGLGPGTRLEVYDRRCRCRKKYYDHD